jgi:hypothetical protein
MKRILAAIGLVACLAVPATAANLTPDELTQATSASNTDLLLIYPAGGPLKAVQWSVFKGLVQSALGPVFLQSGNNLSDVGSPSSARNNLGLGTAAQANTGTTGATVPFLNGVNSWGAPQTLLAGTTTAAPLIFQSGSLLATPLAGAVEWDGASLYATNAGPTRRALAYADGSNLGANAVGLGKLAQIGANTVLGDATGAAASPAALAMPSCSAANQALTWAAAAGFGCGAVEPLTGYAVFVQAEPSGTASPDSIPLTTWTTRLLNTTLVNTIAGASLASNQFTLPAGTYEVVIWHTLTATSSSFKTRVRNVTDATTALVGMSTASSANFAMGQFTITGAKTFAMQVYSAAAAANGGFSTSSGETEIYVIVYIRKVA